MSNNNGKITRRKTKVPLSSYVKKEKTNGRPKLIIDFKLCESLANIFCTGEEIAGVLKVDYDTLRRRIKEEYNLPFSEWIKKHTNSGKASLRRLQWIGCQKGNATMLIWMGKQHLGQTDKVENIGDGFTIDIKLPKDFE